MGKLYDAMSESIFLYKHKNSESPVCIKAGKDAFDIICYENGLLPAMLTCTWVAGVKVVRDHTMPVCEYKCV